MDPCLALLTHAGNPVLRWRFTRKKRLLRSQAHTVGSRCLLLPCNRKNIRSTLHWHPSLPSRSKRTKECGSEDMVHTPVYLANSSPQLSKFAFLPSPNLLLLDISHFASNTVLHFVFHRLANQTHQEPSLPIPQAPRGKAVHAPRKPKGKWLQPLYLILEPLHKRQLPKASVSLHQQQKNL